MHHAFLHEESTFVPTILNLDSCGAVIPCGWIKKSWKSTKAFLKKHKKAIIIGAIIVVTVSAVTVVVIASSSGAASTLAGSAVAIAASNSSDSDWKEEESFSVSSSSFESTIKEEIQSFKEKISEQNLLDPSFAEGDFSIEYKGKTLGNVWAHQTLEELYSDSASSLVNRNSTEMGHREIDRKFCIENDFLYPQVGLDSDNKISLHQIQAEKAFDLGYYPEAIRNLNQAIDIQPNNSTLYLERAASQFHMGQYEHALQDFEKFTTHSNPANIGGRPYSAHAIDQMQNRGFMPSVVEETISKGSRSIGKHRNTIVYYDNINNITVVVNTEGKVITVSYGEIHQ